MTRKPGRSKTISTIGRRDFVKKAALSAAVAAASTGSIPRRVFAQTQKKASFTLPWLPNGASLFMYAAYDRGFFSKRGVDVSISRGFGSVASAQAIAQGKFDFGMSAAPTVYLQAVRGMKLTNLACCTYSPAMGIGYLRSSGIKTPKDLEGRKMGSVVASGEFPFLPAFAERAGFDFSKVETVQVDNKIRTGVLLSKQVDSVSAFASSVAPEVTVKGFDVGWFLYDDYDMPFYGQMLITRPEVLARDKGLCEAVTEACMEGIAWTMLNPEEALDIFFKHVKEAGLGQARRDTYEAELGLFVHINNRPEIRTGGVGTVDMATYEKMADLIMTNVAKPGEAAPALDSMLTMDFVQDRFRFTASELEQITEAAKPYAKLLS